MASQPNLTCVQGSGSHTNLYSGKYSKENLIGFSARVKRPSWLLSPVWNKHWGIKWNAFQQLGQDNGPFPLSIEPLTAFAILSYGKGDFENAGGSQDKDEGKIYASPKGSWEGKNLY